jgi:broad specificity phosphatase PhoE
MSSEANEEPELALVRHAETEWTISGRHTGRTDIPLTARGREIAGSLGGTLAPHSFALVLVSPSQRARETCELAGLGAQVSVNEDLLEWDYGDYDGMTSAEIEARRPGWSLWRDGCPGGETAADVGARADHVIAAALASAGPVAIFSHGHLLRVLGARWAGLPGELGARLGLSPGAVCLLGHEHGRRILGRWNQISADPLA